MYGNTRIIFLVNRPWNLVYHVNGRMQAECGRYYSGGEAFGPKSEDVTEGLGKIIYWNTS
jgi:hypothetical protein